MTLSVPRSIENFIYAIFPMPGAGAVAPMSLLPEAVSVGVNAVLLGILLRKTPDPGHDAQRFAEVAPRLKSPTPNPDPWQDDQIEVLRQEIDRLRRSPDLFDQSRARMLGNVVESLQLAAGALVAKRPTAVDPSAIVNGLDPEANTTPAAGEGAAAPGTSDSGTASGADNPPASSKSSPIKALSTDPRFLATLYYLHRNDYLLFPPPPGQRKGERAARIDPRTVESPDFVRGMYHYFLERIRLLDAAVARGYSTDVTWLLPELTRDLDHFAKGGLYDAASLGYRFLARVLRSREFSELADKYDAKADQYRALHVEQGVRADFDAMQAEGLLFLQPLSSEGVLRQAVERECAFLSQGERDPKTCIQVTRSMRDHILKVIEMKEEPTLSPREFFLLYNANHYGSSPEFSFAQTVVSHLFEDLCAAVGPVIPAHTYEGALAALYADIDKSSTVQSVVQLEDWARLGLYREVAQGYAHLLETKRDTLDAAHVEAIESARIKYQRYSELLGL